MNKKFIFLFLGFGFFLLPALNVLAVPLVNKEESGKYLDHGPGHRYILAVKDLVVNDVYTVMVANNTIDAYNITFTAEELNAEIHLDYTGTKIDVYNNSLNQLQVILANATAVHFTYYIDLKYDNTFASLVSFILELLTFAFTLFLGGFVVIFIARKF